MRLRGAELGRLPPCSMDTVVSAVNLSDIVWLIGGRRGSLRSRPKSPSDRILPLREGRHRHPPIGHTPQNLTKIRWWEAGCAAGFRAGQCLL